MLENQETKRQFTNPHHNEAIFINDEEKFKPINLVEVDEKQRTP